MNLLNEAKKADYVFISVMGPHAQESEKEIFDRKAVDIDKSGESFWVSRINQKFIEECNNKLSLGWKESSNSILSPDSKPEQVAPVRLWSEIGQCWVAINSLILLYFGFLKP